ncbi:hypothetical protein F7734_23400 [Scytonema sp. UIC 10036]|uniref:hypothetical protein n=1 Tax=Scytonema sp. UIC 10036 TaxID=2304196 RepID=UPI0012DA0C7C|nr:hypothetical protein [Scytonema sp. UIC 10036]MUG95146.1 hypothetical protein [Scytonema sp. UIC 10036]
MGQENAGEIFIAVRNTLEVNDGVIVNSSIQSRGGVINITAKDIRLRGDSNISLANKCMGPLSITIYRKSTPKYPQYAQNIHY